MQHGDTDIFCHFCNVLQISNKSKQQELPEDDTAFLRLFELVILISATISVTVHWTTNYKSQ